MHNTRIFISFMFIDFNTIMNAFVMKNKINMHFISI